MNERLEPSVDERRVSGLTHSEAELVKTIDLPAQFGSFSGSSDVVKEYGSNWG